MKDKSQLTHFERNRNFIADIFDEAIGKVKQKNKKIHFNILASKIRFSEKQTRRLFKSYTENPEDFHKHKNKNKIPANKTSEKTKIAVVNYYSYYSKKAFKERGISLRIFHSAMYKLLKLKERFNISYSTTNKILNYYGLISARAHHKTRWKNSWIQKNKLKPEIVEVTKFNKNYELAKQFAAFKVLKLLKPKVGCFGRVVEYDGCVEHWCNKEKYYMLAAVDSFIGILLAIRFEDQETTKGYYYLSNDLFKKYELPRQIKTDWRTTF